MNRQLRHWHSLKTIIQHPLSFLKGPGRHNTLLTGKSTETASEPTSDDPRGSLQLERPGRSTETSLPGQSSSSRKGPGPFGSSSDEVSSSSNPLEGFDKEFRWEDEPELKLDLLPPHILAATSRASTSHRESKLLDLPSFAPLHLDTIVASSEPSSR
ncbi:hypothetical protein K443DRAFT_280101 [Laccaria amethystina LaAM-08-1]|uniref:Uncharacterized protein n=1 Tax=Laccaria amethystina LaAM-08-1 TaxID=1095629 RepID=A0A0C9XMV4_9AGAR|nr:hypothetical protein K443DRAFT_280101 [Laccaria amethystina LaAM-08-1]